MNTQQILQHLGLDEKSSRVYLACLRLGPTSMTNIAKAAGLKRPTTYLAVDNLQIRGLLTSSQKGSRQVYIAEHPKRLLQFLRNQEKDLEEALPELEAQYYEPTNRPRLRIYEGRDGLKSIYNDAYSWIGRKKEILFYSAIGDLQEKFPELITYFVRDIRKKTGNRIRELIVKDEKGINYSKNTKVFRGKNHLVKFIDSKFIFTDMDLVIFGDTVILSSLAKDIFAVRIDNSLIANAQKSLFNMAWEMGV